MSKRFTDLRRWKDPWFRSLPLQAKLLWIYINDECDSTGIWMPEYDVATTRLGFDITPTVATLWFFPNIFVIDEKRLLVVTYFYEQYSESKDSWSAKSQAKIKLERLGFIIENNRVKDPNYFFNDPTTSPLSPQSGTTPLNTNTDTNKSINISEAKKRIGSIQQQEHFRILADAAEKCNGDLSPQVQEQLKQFKARFNSPKEGA